MTDRKPNALGISLVSPTSPAQLVDAYRLIERSGFDELWVHEDYFYHGGFSAAALALQATSRIPVGIGIVSTAARHPVATAMEIATLAGAHPGRLTVGIGHGATSCMRQIGVHPQSPLSALAEVLRSIRRLLAGETLTESGLFRFDGVRLAHPPGEGQVPLYAGVVGPKSLALSGELADGTVLSVMSGPKYIEHARRLTREAAARAGRSGAHPLPTIAFCAIGADGRQARRLAGDTLAAMMGAFGPDLLTDVYGISEELSELLAARGGALAASDLPESWLDWFMVAGDPDRCSERVRELHRAGATSVVLALIDTSDIHASIELIAREVLPQV
jgi:alkanesulfonate monooxygenase SsuD/methylene tetrahydromethanopterin reductase-like flavin-dependent oxidoreductase (luciferase family)